MTQKWNLQDIRPAQPRKQRSTPPKSNSLQKNTTKTTSSRTEAEDVMSINITDGNKKKRFSLISALVVFFIIICTAILFTTLTSGSEVTVYPKFKEPNVNAVFPAYREPQPEELAYEIMTLEAEGERQVSATGQEKVKKQTEGTIFIYNKHQSKSIRLVTNTRFESNGLIFRIKDAAVVPGYTKDDQGNVIPGVISAEVFADEAGEEYNLKPSRFTIPGFAGEPEFDNIYAESTEEFVGGFDGVQFIIDKKELQTAKQALQMELRNSLLERISQEKPADLIVFPNAVTFTYTSLPSVEYGDNLATIKEKVILRIPLFKKDNLASFLARATVPGYEGGPVRITDTSTLTFKYTNATTSSSDISKETQLSFKLTGRPQIVWEFDAEKLKADLLNKNKTALTSVLGGYPAITKAEAVLKPFWKTKFPLEIDKITITEVIE